MEVDLHVNMIGSYFPPSFEATRDGWKHGIIEVLKDSTSKDRKLLRWKTVGRRMGYYHRPLPGDYEVVESEEIEVLPERSL